MEVMQITQIKLDLQVLFLWMATYITVFVLRHKNSALPVEIELVKYRTLWVKIFVRFALSLTVCEIRAIYFFRFENLKMQKLGVLPYPEGQNFRPFRSISYRFRDTDDFIFSVSKI